METSHMLRTSITYPQQYCSASLHCYATARKHTRRTCLLHVTREALHSCIATETCGIVLLLLGYRCSKHVGCLSGRFPHHLQVFVAMLMYALSLTSNVNLHLVACVRCLVIMSLFIRTVTLPCSGVSSVFLSNTDSATDAANLSTGLCCSLRVIAH
jgi:hypothetical protein